MAANDRPIFSRQGDIQWDATPITAANTAKDGTGTVVTAFTADALEGGFVDKIFLRAVGTNIASLARVFINNGSDNTVAANNVLFKEAVLPATTTSETAEIGEVVIDVQVALPPGYKLNVVLATAVAAGWVAGAIGGKY